MSVAQSFIKQTSPFPFVGGTPVPLGYTVPVGLTCDDPSQCNPCDAYPNGDVDWWYNIVQSGTSATSYCSQVNPTICPAIPGSDPPQFPPTRWASNDDSQSINTSPSGLAHGRIARCDYPLDIFTTTAAVTGWLNTFNGGNSTNFAIPGNEETWNTAIMPFFCSQFSDNCQPYPTTLGSTGCPGGRTGCSTMMAAGTPYCLQWYGRLDAASQDQFTQQFCSGTGVCSQDCLCANRDTDPVFQSFINASPPTLDACWYQPCQDGTKYLIPSEQRILPGICPSTICSQNIFIEGGTNNNINIDVAQALISCSLGGTGANPTNPVSFWEAYGVYILIGGIILLVIVLGIALAAHYQDV